MLMEWVEEFERGKENKLSKADKMFEELGYSKLSEVSNNERIIVYRRINGKHIQFNHLVEKVMLAGKYQFVDMEELQAINEKCKELGVVIVMNEEEILDIKRENYKLRKENFELIQDNVKLQEEKNTLYQKLCQKVSAEGYQLLKDYISKDKIREINNNNEPMTITERVEFYQRELRKLLEE